MDELLLCSTASTPTPGVTTGTPTTTTSVAVATTNDGTSSYSAIESKDNEEEMEKENEKGKESNCVYVEALQSKRRKKTTSEVWNDFERTVHGDNSVTATCKHCGKIFNGASTLGTTHLNNHKKTCKRRTHKDVVQQILALSKSTSKSVPKLESFNFDQERTRKDFVRMIAKHCYPIDMIEHEYFQIYVNNINPIVKFSSRNKVRNDIIDVFQEEKEKLYEFLGKLSSRVSLTTELCTVEHQNFGYRVVTCHYIDDDWNLHKRILSFKMLPTPLSAEAISEHIKGQLMNWNIHKKICSIVMDNASTNDYMINYLKLWLGGEGALLRNGEIFYVHCIAHILQLIIQDGLEELREALVKIRDMVRWVNDSPSRFEKFGNALVQTKLSNKGSVSVDVATEWNSTYEMLHNALEVREAFDHLAELDKNFKTLPTEEWEKCESVGQCIKVFNDAMKNVSDSKYPTVNFYFGDVCDVHHHLLQWSNSRDDCIRSMAFTMRLKFEKYWKEINLFMALGVILDPRYKMELIVHALNAIYGDDADYHIKKIKFDVVDFYSEYACNYGGSCYSHVVRDASDCVGGNENDSCDDIPKKKISEFKKYMKQRSRVVKHGQKSELDMYLEESLFPIGDNEYCFDILHWWKQNGPKFPILARMARDIFAVPTSTVVLESASSVGGRFITEHHPLLTPDVVEALICLRDWLPSYKYATTVDE